MAKYSRVKQSGDVTNFTSTAELPLSELRRGETAFANNSLYISNGSGWYRITLVNESPSITLDSETVSLGASGNTVTVGYTVVEPEGTPVIVSLTTTANSSQANFTINSSNNSLTIENLSAEGFSANVILSATDGVNIGTDSLVLTVAYLSELWDETVLSIGTSSTNSLDNSTFIDRSTNAHTVTPTGSPVQTAFHPYLDNWSVEFDGSSYFTAGLNTDWTVLHNGLNTWTAEFTCYITNMSVTNAIFGTNINSTNGNRGLWVYVNSSGQLGGSFTAGTDGYRLDWTTTSTGLISENKWHIVSLTFNPNNSQGNYFSATIDETAITEFSEITQVGNNPNGADFNFSTSAPVYPLHIAAARGPQSGVVGIFNGYLTNFKIDVESQTKLQCFNDNRFIDRSDNNYTLNLVSSPKISAFNPFGQESEYAVGENKGSVRMIQTNTEFLVTPQLASLSSTLLANNFTIEAWVYLEEYASVGASHIWNNTQTHSDQQTALYIYPDGRIMVGKVGLNEVGSVAGTIKLNVWHHVAIVGNGATTRIYVDGADVANGASSTYLNSSNVTHMKIGRSSQNSGDNSFPGYISDFKVTPSAVYTSAFTPPTAPVGSTNADLYLPFDNAGIFDKTGLNTLTPVGNASTSTTQTKYADTAIYFDGTGDYLTGFGDMTAMGSGDFTWECWVYFNAFGTFSGIIDSRLSSGGGANAGLIYANGATLKYWSGGSEKISGSTLSTGQWYHVAAVRNSGTVTLYLNGTSEGFASDSVDMTTPILRIGDTFDNYPLNGYMENLQILKGVAKYTANFTAPNRTQGRAYQAES